jgi:hypothetical protein
MNRLFQCFSILACLNAPAATVLNPGDTLHLEFTTTIIDCGPCTVDYVQLFSTEGVNASNDALAWTAYLRVEGDLLGTYTNTVAPDLSTGLRLAQWDSASQAVLTKFETGGLRGEIDLIVQSGSLRFLPELNALGLEVTAWHIVDANSAIGQVQPLTLVTLQAVPEPSSAALMIAPAVILLFWRSRLVGRVH